MTKKDSPRLVNRNCNAARITALAHRPGGMATKDIDDLPTSTIGKLMLELCREKVIYQAKTHHRFCRYFGTAAEALEWVATNIVHKQAPAVQQLSQPPSHGTCAGRWARDAIVTWPTHADGTPAYKITHATPPPTGIFRTSTHAR